METKDEARLVFLGIWDSNFAIRSVFLNNEEAAFESFSLVWNAALEEAASIAFTHGSEEIGNSIKELEV